MNSYGYKLSDVITKRIDEIARISELLATCTNTTKQEKLKAELKAMVPKAKCVGRPRKKLDLGK